MEITRGGWMDLGERIAVLREEQALTQADLAEVARISPSTLSQIESGRVPRPHVGTVRKIARALGVEPAELRRAKEPAVPLAEAPTGGAVPNSLEDLLKSRGVRTRHLADEDLKDKLAGLPLEAAVQTVREVGAEMEAIAPDLAHLVDQHLNNPRATRLYSEAVNQLFIARYSLHDRQGQKFVPLELRPEMDQTEQALDRVALALAGTG